MYQVTIKRPTTLLNDLTEIIGDVVEGKETKLRRLAAIEIARVHIMFHNANNGQDVLIGVREFVELKYRLADPFAYFAEELRTEPEPYSADGILFPALVHLLRIEDGMFVWDWLPEQVRALGLAINPGEEIAWPITREFVTIKDRDGRPRRFYRLS